MLFDGLLAVAIRQFLVFEIREEPPMEQLPMKSQLCLLMRFPPL
ncbi:hypothetical protein EVA_20292 [gut metagenome]|uniref:Uncharacterized protein n=1 Tax=gut metagenome TaxID=749906 RepID=J9F9N1_9ZZZZ